MTSKLLFLALSLSACTTDEPTTKAVARNAQLAEAGDTGPATRGWYQTESGLSYEAYRSLGAGNRLHHLDVNDYVGGDLALAPGKTYVDGPAVANRGALNSHLLEDGTIDPSVPRPWIDLIACDGDFTVGPANCVTADRTELVVEDVADGQRVTYKSTLPDGALVSGSFVVQPGQLHGQP